MVFVNQFLKPFLKHVGVDFSRGYVRVAKELLDGAQIGATIEQVTGKRMAQDVRANALRCNSGCFGQFFQVLREPLPRQMALGT